MLKWIKKKIHKGYYPQKCKTEGHISKIITPTLQRIAILNKDAPCECGYYKNHQDFMSQQFELLRKELIK